MVGEGIRAILWFPELVMVEVTYAAVTGCNPVATGYFNVETLVHVLANYNVCIKEDTDFESGEFGGAKLRSCIFEVAFGIADRTEW